MQLLSGKVSTVGTGTVLKVQCGRFVALIGINNPHITTEEIPSYKICQEIPSHPLISNLVAPEDIYKGVCYACSVPDARAAILDIPFLEISGILGVNDSSAVSLNISLLLLSFCIFSFI